MELIEKKENQITIKAEIDESLANSIRRYVTQIPVLAIDEIEIYKNDSALYDETVAHRMGMIPIKTEGKAAGKKESEIKILSKKEGPVLSGEITGNAKIVYDRIPITILQKNQELEITGFVRIGRGVDHSKFSPGLIFYRNVSEIILDKDLKEDVKRICPDVEIKERGNKIVIIDDKKQDVTDVCEGVAKERGKDVEVHSKEELILTIESFGQMSANEIFARSIEELKSDLEEVGKKIK